MRPKRYIIPVFVPHLGCPHNCVFCNQRRISGQVRPQTAQTVKEEIEKALPRIPDGAETELAFYGGSFTAISPSQQEELLGAVRPYIRENKIKSIRLSTRPDCIDRETVERLLSYNVKTVELGVQSLDDEVLRLSERGHSQADAIRAVGIIRQTNLKLILQMMTGLPGDTADKAVATAEKILELKPDGVRIYPTVIVKDTPLYDMYLEGRYKENTVEDAVEICSVIVPMFRKAGIPVIRLGLNPTEELSGGAAAGGAYHPALGQLVESRIYLKKAEEIIKETFGGTIPDKLIFEVGRGQTSTFVGQKRRNVLELRDKYGIREIKVLENMDESGRSQYLRLKKYNDE